MKKNNFLGVVLVFILIAVIRIIGIENIPFSIIVLILTLCIIVAFFNVLKYKGSKKERIYLLVMTILVTLLLSVIVIAVVIQNRYPEFSQTYKPIFIALMSTLFIGLLIAVFFNAIYKYNKGNKTKRK